MSRYAARVLTGIGLALLAAGLLVFHASFPAARLVLVVVTLLAILCAYELDHMGALNGRGLGIALYVPTLFLATAMAFGRLGLSTTLSAPARLALLYGYTALFALPGVVLARFVGTTAAEGERSPLAAVATALWLLPPLFALVVLEQQHGPRGLAVFVILAKIGDNAGYFVGKHLGRHHPFPRVSPNKTTEGCLASLAAGVIGGAALLPWTLGERTAAGIATGALCGALVNVAAQASDLSESWVKRRAGVKDSGKVAGASGGVLDVIDSVFLAAPVALLLWWACY